MKVCHSWLWLTSLHVSRALTNTYCSAPELSPCLHLEEKKPDNARQSPKRKKQDGPFSPGSAILSIPPTILPLPLVMAPKGSVIVDRMGYGCKQVRLAQRSSETAISSETGLWSAEVLTYRCPKRDHKENYALHLQCCVTHC